jgi:molybdopterin-guanine dinucleotide biosynthesis protein A
MGTDKGLLPYKGKELIRHVIDALKPLSAEIYIIANGDAYGKFGIKCYPDHIAHGGPLGGIHTGLLHSNTDWIFCVACDMPYLDAELIRFLASQRENYQAVVPFHHGNPEPLCAFYHKSGMVIFEEALGNGRFKIQNAYSGLNYLHVDIPEAFFRLKNPFSNFNTPGDMEQEL